MKTKQIFSKILSGSKTRATAFFLAFMLSASLSFSVCQPALDNQCYYVSDNNVFISLQFQANYWGCRHPVANAGIYAINYSLELYDNSGINVVGTYPASSNSNPILVNLGNLSSLGLVAPYHVRIIETEVNISSGAVTDVMEWGFQLLIDAACKPDPNEVTGCFSNDPNSIFSKVTFQVPASLYTYCQQNNLTPVLYVPAGGPISPLSFSGQTLVFNVFPWFDPSDCFHMSIMLMHNNNNNIIDVFWDSYNQIDGDHPDGTPICACTICDSKFKIDQHAHNAGSVDVSFIPLGAAYSQTYTISGSNGFFMTTDGMSSVLLPNGTYTICHTVVMKDRTTCKECKVVIIDAEEAGYHGLIAQKIAVSPNPASGTAALLFSVNEAGPVGVQIVNSFGNVVKTLLENKYLSVGDQSLDFSTTGLDNGLYVVTISAGTEVRTVHLVVNH